MIFLKELIMFNAKSHVDMDMFITGVDHLDILSLHSQFEIRNTGTEDSLVVGSDPTKLRQAVQEAKPGTNFCMTYRQGLNSFAHATFTKVDNLGVFFHDQIPGYSFADADTTAKVVKEGTEVI